MEGTVEVDLNPKGRWQSGSEREVPGWVASLRLPALGP